MYNSINSDEQQKYSTDITTHQIQIPLQEMNISANYFKQLTAIIQQNLNQTSQYESEAEHF
jgi:hypothetical protein